MLWQKKVAENPELPWSMAMERIGSFLLACTASSMSCLVCMKALKE
jgi:hypothetical protein